MIDAQQRLQTTVRSLLMSSTGARLTGASTIVVMLWLSVAWALK